MTHHFHLLDFDKTIQCPNQFFTRWWDIVGEELILSPQGKETAILAILDGNDDGEMEKAEILAKYIEEEDGVWDTMPFFVMWLRGGPTKRTIIQEYAPFENGVRQLKKTY